MNELTSVPSKQKNQNLLANRLFMFIPVLFLLRGKVSNNPQSTNFFEPINNLVSSLNIENIFTSLNAKTIEKNIHTIKKIGPYLPEHVIPTVNSLVLTFEKVNRALSLVDFFSTARDYSPISPVSINNNREKIGNVINILSNELPEEKGKQIRPIIDMVTNIDKLKGVISAVSSLANSSDQPTNSIDTLIEVVSPLLGGKNIDKEKIKEMIGMMEMIKILNSDDDE